MLDKIKENIQALPNIWQKQLTTAAELNDTGKDSDLSLFNKIRQFIAFFDGDNAYRTILDLDKGAKNRTILRNGIKALLQGLKLTNKLPYVSMFSGAITTGLGLYDLYKAYKQRNTLDAALVAIQSAQQVIKKTDINSIQDDNAKTYLTKIYNMHAENGNVAKEFLVKDIQEQVKINNLQLATGFYYLASGALAISGFSWFYDLLPTAIRWAPFAKNLIDVINTILPMKKKDKAEAAREVSVLHPQPAAAV